MTMEKKPVREIIATVFKALTLALGIAVVVCCPVMAVWKRKPPSPCLVSAWPAPVSPCWKNGNALPAFPSGECP